MYYNGQMGYPQGGYGQMGYSQGGYDQMGYQQGGYGQMGYSQDAYGYPKVTKAQVIQGLRDYVISSTQMPINAEVKIDETPDVLRHACAGAGVSKLSMCHFYVYATGLDVPFYFCMSCGKLFYPRDIML